MFSQASDNDKMRLYISFTMCKSLVSSHTCLSCMSAAC